MAQKHGENHEEFCIDAQGKEHFTGDLGHDVIHIWVYDYACSLHSLYRDECCKWRTWIL